METFQMYFILGKEHILDYAHGYDHILFIIALCTVYVLRDWKKILTLITAFTIGHSVTLALATVHIISFNSGPIEFLIPITIFITAFVHIFQKEKEYETKSISLNYLFALFFGLIHGIGFSHYLQTLLGKQQSIFTPLLAFNLGLEFGQIIVVTIFMFSGYLGVNIIGIARRDWRMVISSAIAGASLVWAKENVFW